jgi:hypothetical protein
MNLLRFENIISKHFGDHVSKRILPFATSATLAVAICFWRCLSWAGGVVANATEADLRVAMSGGGTVTFACDGTITLSNTIIVETNTLLDGSSHSISISGRQAFYVNGNSMFCVRALGIANCCATRAAAIFNDHGTLDLNNVVFRNNAASPACDPSAYPWMQGGAIYNQGGVVNATNCKFAYNSAWVPVSQSGLPTRPRGGAVYNDGGAMVLQQCVFAGNQAAAGSANYGLPDPGFQTYGGAIYNTGTLNADSCAFLFNSAQGGNGGNAPVNSGWPGGPGGAACGGAIYNLGALTVSRSLFASNSVSAGKGGDGGRGASGQIYGGTGGSGGSGAAASGGGVDGSGSFVNCTFVGNTAGAGGGGWGGVGGDSLYQIGAPGGTGGNGGNAGGGAISGNSSLVNCTVAACSARSGVGGAGGAGGVGPKGYGTPGSPGVTGSADNGGAGGTLINSLLASNTPGSDTFPDAKLALLADNGGPTLTMAALPGSPAIDAGEASGALVTDQRGFPRPAGLAADFGAFEYGSMLPILSITRSGPTIVNVSVQGNSNQWCRLLASSNLFSWNPIATNQFGPDGTIQFQDNNSAASCYYRVVMP